MPDHKLFRAGVWLLLVFVLIWVGSQINYAFLQPIALIVQTLLTPLLIAGILFFLLRPPVRFLVARKVPRVPAILIVYLLLIIVIFLLLLTVGPMIQAQFSQLANGLPGFIQNAVNASTDIVNSQRAADWLGKLNIDVDGLASRASELAMTLFNVVSSNVSRFLGMVVNFVVILVMVPFILFYFLKDGEKMVAGLMRLVPQKRQEQVRTLLTELDHTVSQFIRGQFTVALCVGLLLWIGYQIIGLKFAVILALISMVTNVIPYLGAFLAAVPALIVGLSQSPGLAVKVLIVTIVAQQLEGNLLSPLIVGKGLSIHPLTIILLLLAAGALMGPLGLLFAVPGYALLKVVLSHLYRWRSEKREESTPAA